MCFASRLFPFCGSPPQVRGKVDKIPAHKVCRRITPAGAGKSAWNRMIEEERRDHPRRCGEKDDSKRSFQILLGSPPQVRGKVEAGSGRELLAEDHPRRCGEKPENKTPTRSGRGSPPQVRGKVTHLILSMLHPRITPAGAGKSSRPPDSAGWEEDHPRRCGEKCEFHDSLTGAKGSPPQVRGKVSSICCKHIF